MLFVCQRGKVVAPPVRKKKLFVEKEEKVLKNIGRRKYLIKRKKKLLSEE